jgi:hypothetical protein
LPWSQLAGSYGVMPVHISGQGDKQKKQRCRAYTCGQNQHYGITFQIMIFFHFV